MVATRRGTRTGPGEQAAPSLGTNETLSKKPIRKATATRTATAKSSDTTTKASTRARANTNRSVRNVEETANDEAEAQKEQAATIQEQETVRSTRRPVTRSRPGDDRKKAQDVSVSSVPDTTKKSVRVNTSRQQDAPKSTRDGPVLDSSQTSSRIRVSRAVKPTSRPLSPKKIVQISQTRTRGKGAAVEQKSSLVAPTMPTRRTTRKRAESDENVEPLAVAEVVVEIPPITAMATGAASPTRTVPGKSPQRQIQASVQIDGLVSSIPPTPSESPVSESPVSVSKQSKVPAADRTVACETSADAMQDLEHAICDEVTNEPEDELCNPETSRRRTSGSAHVHPRAASHPTTTISPTRQSSLSRSQQKPDEISSTSTEPVADDSGEHEASVAQHDTVQSQRPDSPESIKSDFDKDAPCQTIETVGVREQSGDLEVAGADTNLKYSSLDGSEVAEESDASIVDPNETIVIEEEDDETHSLAQTLSSPVSTVSSRNSDDEQAELQPEDAVDESQVEDDDDEIEDAEDTDLYEDNEDDYTRLTISTKALRPETIVWQNLQSHGDIPMDFDLHSSPRIDRSQLGVMPDLNVGEHTVMNSAAVPNEELPNDDQTVNFTEFVTIPTISEPFQVTGGDTFSLEDAVESVAQVVDGGSEAVEQSRYNTPEPETLEPTLIISPVQSQEEELAPSPILSVQSSTAASEASASQEANINVVDDAATPGYMQRTLSFDARRKSLPTASLHTPVKTSAPTDASDCATLPHLRLSAEEIWALGVQPAIAYLPVTTVSPARERRTLAPFALPTKTSATTSTNTPARKSRSDATPMKPHARPKERQTIKQHPKTIAAPSRLREISHPPGKPCVSMSGGTSMRKIVLNDSTPTKGYCSLKTRMKSPMVTPGHAVMTPHKNSPLRGVVAIVEIFTLEGASASAPFVALLHRLGAKTTKIWGDRVTHVIFKDGSPTTLQRVKQHNTKVEKLGHGNKVHCVNSRWISDCDAEGVRAEETDEAYTIDVNDAPRSGKRKRKSMEPSTLVVVDGNIVRDRKSTSGRSSLGRSSFGRATMDFESSLSKDSVQPQTPTLASNNTKQDASEDSSPATPAWIAAPEKLIQATAPIKRMRLLEMRKNDATKDRRRTLWNN